MKINSIVTRCLSFTLIFGVLSWPATNVAKAEMVSTDAFLAQHSSSNPRSRLMNMLDRQEVQKKLQEYGVSPGEARMRLASLSDSEIEKLNTKMNKLPAGADAAEAILGTALVVFIVLLITDILCLTKVFKFTRCAQ
jgi:uncharacterized small protein (DUF1192 family)